MKRTILLITLALLSSCAHTGRTQGQCREICNNQCPGEGWRTGWSGPVFPTDRWYSCMKKCRST